MRMTAVEKHFVNGPEHTLQVAGRAQKLLDRIDIPAGWRTAHPLPGDVRDRAAFHDAEFHIVASSMATHHIPGWERAFSEMVRVLRPGGYLIDADFMFPSWLASAGRLQA